MKEINNKEYSFNKVGTYGGETYYKNILPWASEIMSLET